MNNERLTTPQRTALACSPTTPWGRRLPYTTRHLTIRSLAARGLVSEWSAPADDAPGGHWLTPLGEKIRDTLPLHHPDTSCSGALLSTPCARRATFELESTIFHPRTGAASPGHRLLACTQHMGRVADRLLRELPKAPVAVAGEGLFLTYAFTPITD